MKMKSKDIAAAKARGFLTGDDVKILRARAGERRVCVTCGRQFRTPTQTGTRMFGCGCCALVSTREEPPREIRKGDRVTLIWLGEAGLVVGFAKETSAAGEETILAVVDTEKGGNRYGVKSDEIERVHAFDVDHAPTCQHGRRFVDWRAKPKEDEEAEGDD